MLPLLFALWEFLGCESFQEEMPKQNFITVVVLLFSELQKKSSRVPPAAPKGWRGEIVVMVLC